MRLPGRGRGVLVVDRTQHGSRAVPAAVAVAAVEPVQHDGLGMDGIDEVVSRADFPFQTGEERLSGPVVEWVMRINRSHKKALRCPTLTQL